MKMNKLIGGAALASLALALPAIAQEVAAEVPAVVEEVAAIDTGDTAWMIVSTLLVIMMTIPGVALFYGGLVRAKNVLSVVTQVFGAFSMIALLWVAYGYSLAFSGPTEGGLSAFIGDFSNLFLANVTPDAVSGTIPELVFVVFQLTFACITAALVVGGIAERMKFGAVMAFLAIWFTFSYLPIAHMVWSGAGLFFNMGALDFAGGTVVHINSGVAALVAAIVLGPRMGYMKEPIAPHNLVFVYIGASLLWVGWFGFNAGSALGANGLAAQAFLNTITAPAAAAIAWA
ncbi:MAG: ammonium transporter, partial [Phyllobacteriaceae bacterium]|nr:ammonium transporter [Phyllobacteriaceae bacterium]